MHRRFSCNIDQGVYIVTISDWLYKCPGTDVWAN
jgi:hypothetical protein